MKRSVTAWLLLGCALVALPPFLAGCLQSNAGQPLLGTNKNLPLEKIKLPPGFQISVFAQGVENARSMCMSESGTIFVGTRQTGAVYALVDTNGDFKADKQYTLAKGLNMPNGVAFLNGDLYVAEVNRILRFRSVEANLANPPKPEVVFSGYPSDKHHGWKFMALGPDGWLYVPVGAPCNICLNQDKPIYASITRLSPDGKQMEIFAEGIRNTVGFDWHPDTGELWFTNNGRDYMGDDLPPDELNHAPKPGLHFGYPFCHGGDIPDPEFGKQAPCSDFTPPALKLGAHVAPLGMRFYRGEQFPEKFRKKVFMAEHGSWNRSSKVGYRITTAEITGSQASNYAVFAEGWLQGNTAWGRPVDVLNMPDGSLLVSDDLADAVYHISYQP